MKAKTISISNFKGGVGKTTSTLNIGAAMARKGKRVLLVDLDPQYNLTTSLPTIDQPVPTAFNVLCEKAQPVPAEVAPNLHLIPSSLSLIKAETLLTSRLHREYILRKALEPLEPDFDFILLDCPPALGNITLNAYFASDLIFVPVEAEFLSFGGATVLQEALAEIEIEIDRIFLTRYDGRKTLNKEVKKAILADPRAFKTIIRSNVALAECPAHKQTIFDYSPRSNGAKDYDLLTTEIITNYAKEG